MVKMVKKKLDRLEVDPVAATRSVGPRTRPQGPGNNKEQSGPGDRPLAGKASNSAITR